MSIFVAFEGIDGAGKSTQLNRVAKRLLQAPDMKVARTRDPGGTAVGNALRDMLLDTSIKMDAYTQMMLMSAARCELTRTVIIPELEKGNIVLCDRYVASTHAYQGAQGVSQRDIDDVHYALTYIYPDLTILLDIDANFAITRKGEGPKDRYEEKGRQFLQQVRYLYLDYAARHTYMFTVIDGTLPIDVITDQICIAIKSVSRSCVN